MLHNSIESNIYAMRLKQRLIDFLIIYLVSLKIRNFSFSQFCAHFLHFCLQTGNYDFIRLYELIIFRLFFGKYWDFVCFEKSLIYATQQRCPNVFMVWRVFFPVIVSVLVFLVVLPAGRQVNG